MKHQKYYLVWLLTVFLSGLTGKASFGFTIIPAQPDASEFYRKESYYTVDDLIGKTELDTRLWWDPNTWNDTVGGVTEIKRGGTGEFLRRLTQWSLVESSPEYTWSFLPAENDLEGSFEIVTNQACGYRDGCGDASTDIEPVRTGIYRGVGSLFHVKYYPGLNDPMPGQNKLHWIQMVQANYNSNSDSFLSNLIPSFPIVVIDNGGSPGTPYYDRPGGRFAGEDFFIDRPYASGKRRASGNHYFNAQLYLVEEITPPESKKREVKIYNGIRWGWKNQVSEKKQDQNPVCPPGSEPNLASNNSDSLVASNSSECVVAKKFSESLSSGIEEDNFNLDGLTPGATFYAWINNDLPSNQCNPNTYLSGYDDEGYFLGADDNSSHLGDGFASSVLGTVSSNGRINLSVKAADGGRRGEDEGNYELYVNVFNTEDFPIGTGNEDNNNGSIALGGSGGGGIIVGGSGGGGVIFGNPDGGNIEDTPGRTQQNPILPSRIDSDGWQHFSNVPGCRWYDPPIEKGFEFVATDNTLFTEILDFPVGEDDLFTVMVDDLILGEFSPGDRVDFLSLLGSGVSRFKVTDIDYFIGDTEETYFPIQLAFDKNVGSFKMRPIVTEEEKKKQKVPESNSVWGLIGLGVFGVWKFMVLRNRK
ncbi:hypothetical protein [Roseofilum capinflatum]|uniref:Uncharacterized protein n=1 Tax=Roseofilum capinflatum BLCC-M114 TaxID=3022440 RepID=A0ABT7B049_9CYAN|nr:hypothetical protein [Roseofilum capinflatum]MDJ1172547.1 hypothetical protein [Roseofilum capinflatum BLCC-M114]